MTLPNARCKPERGRRGDGPCRLCMVEAKRRYNRSTKTGPPSRYRGDSTTQLDAIEAGKKHCASCREVKDLDDFHRAANGPQGRHSWCKPCCRERRTPAHRANAERYNLQRRANTYGITVEELKGLIAAQDGRCAICSKPCVSGRQLAVDHNHETGQVRGLLCANCNRGIGLLQDSADNARSAAEYLTRWTTRAVVEEQAS